MAFLLHQHRHIQRPILACVTMATMQTVGVDHAAIHSLINESASNAGTPHLFPNNPYLIKYIFNHVQITQCGIYAREVNFKTVLIRVMYLNNTHEQFRLC